MKKITNKPKTRAEISNPWHNIPHNQRSIDAGVVDLRDNYTIEDLGNGYIRVNAIDNTKLFK